MELECRNHKNCTDEENRNFVLFLLSTFYFWNHQNLRPYLCPLKNKHIAKGFVLERRGWRSGAGSSIHSQSLLTSHGPSRWHFKDDQNAETWEEPQSFGAIFLISQNDSTDIFKARFFPEMKYALASCVK